jgi:hypothetical protein
MERCNQSGACDMLANGGQLCMYSRGKGLMPFNNYVCYQKSNIAIFMLSWKKVKAMLRVLSNPAVLHCWIAI